MKPTKAEIKHLQELYAAVEDAVTAYEEAITELAERLREEFDEKSERWQQGERGQEVEELISALASANFKPIPSLDELGL